VLVGEAVPGAPAVWYGVDEPAPAQARELIRHHLSEDPERGGQIRRVRRRFAQRQEHACAGAVGEGVAEARERSGMGD
jgi:hypothetical protein